jgi:predicted RNA-binding protein YlxR (DUF448 family)
VCRTRRPQSEFVRLTRLPEGMLRLDRGPRRAAGRGAYVCPAVRCLRNARRALERALGVAVSDELLDELRERIAAS